jgi:hypothetical protein
MATAVDPLDKKVEMSIHEKVSFVPSTVAFRFASDELVPQTISANGRIAGQLHQLQVWTVLLIVSL